MDKFVVKRKAEPEIIDVDEEQPAEAKKKAKVSRPTLVVLPGASGSLSAAMNAALDKLASRHGFTIIRRDKVKWNTYAAKAPGNTTAVLEMCPTDKDYFVLGNSFGNRVVCEMLKDDKFTPEMKGAILCGFPLYGDKNVSDRVDQLRSIPEDANVMIISGTPDEFLHRSFLDKKGRDLMSQVFEEMNLERGSLEFIENGVHDLPKCKGKNAKADSVVGEAKLLKLIVDFCSSSE